MSNAVTEFASLYETAAHLRDFIRYEQLSL